MTQAANESTENARLAAKAAGGLRPLRALVPFGLRYRGRIAAALGALMLASAATLAVPLAVRQMIDFGFAPENAGFIDRYFEMMLLVAAVLAAASALRYYLVITLGERVVADLREALFAHVIALSPAFYDRERVGEIVSRLTADTTQIKSAFGTSASIALRNFVLFLGAATMMVVTSPHLSALVMIAIPLIVLPLVAFGRMVTRRARAAQDTLADASAFAVEAIGSVRTVQALTGEDAARAAFRRCGRALLRRRPAIDERAGLAHRGDHLPRLRKHRRRLVDRRAGGAGGEDHGGNAQPVRPLCGIRGRRPERAFASVERAQPGGGRGGTDRGAAERRVRNPRTGAASGACKTRARRNPL